MQTIIQRDRILGQFILILSIFLLSGCIRIGSAVFINSTDQNITVSIYGIENEDLFVKFDIEPRQSYKVPHIYLGKIEVFSNLLNETLIVKRVKEDAYMQRIPEHFDRKTYFLITVDNVYLVPKKYRLTWDENLEKIIEYNKKYNFHAVY